MLPTYSLLVRYLPRSIQFAVLAFAPARKLTKTAKTRHKKKFKTNFTQKKSFKIRVWLIPLLCEVVYIAMPLLNLLCPILEWRAQVYRVGKRGKGWRKAESGGRGLLWMVKSTGGRNQKQWCKKISFRQNRGGRGFACCRVGTYVLSCRRVGTHYVGR